jgi:hypothetical protein
MIVEMDHWAVMSEFERKEDKKTNAVRGTHFAKDGFGVIQQKRI